MKGEVIRIGKKEIGGFVIPIGKVNLVFARTDKGLVGCGAFDVMALDSGTWQPIHLQKNLA